MKQNPIALAHTHACARAYTYMQYVIVYNNNILYKRAGERQLFDDDMATNTANVLITNNRRAYAFSLILI